MSTPHPPSKPERVSIPLDEAAVVLGCSRVKVYDLIHAGHLKTYLIGNRRFTTRGYIDECVRTLTKRSSVRSIRAPRAHQETIDAINTAAEEGP